MNSSTTTLRSLLLAAPMLVIALIVTEFATSQDASVPPSSVNDPNGSYLTPDEPVSAPSVSQPQPSTAQSEPAPPVANDSVSPESPNSQLYPPNPAVVPTVPNVNRPAGAQPVPTNTDPNSDFQLLQPYRDNPSPRQPVPQQVPGAPATPNAVPQYQVLPRTRQFYHQPEPRQTTELRICYLKFAEAETCAVLLRELFQQQDITITFDARINAIIVRAPASPDNRSPLKEIEEVLAQLDKEAPARSEPEVIDRRFPSTSPLNDLTPNSAGLIADSPVANRSARDAEARANEMAQALRGPQPQPLSSSQVDQRREQLRAAVAEAFAARQRMHQAQLNVLRHRLARVEQQVKARETLKERIIDRRTDELLDPNLDWETGLDLGKAPRAVRPVPAVGLPGMEPVGGAAAPALPVTETTQSQADPRQANLPPSASAPPPIIGNNRVETTTRPAQPNGTVPSFPNTLILPGMRLTSESGLAIRSPSEFIGAVRGIEKMISDSNRWPASISASQRERMEAVRDRYHAQLATIRREYKTMIDSLKSQLAASQAEFESSENDLRRLEKISIAGAISISEIDKARVTVAKARARIEQLKATLELYVNSEAAIFGNVATDAVSQLEGSWKIVTQSSGDDTSDIPDGRVVIAGKRLTLHIDDSQPPTVALLTIDGVNRWLEMEVNPESDSPNHMRGIYRLEGNRLRFVLGESGKRPSGFSEVGKTGISYWELRRDEGEGTSPDEGGSDDGFADHDGAQAVERSNDDPTNGN